MGGLVSCAAGVGWGREEGGWVGFLVAGGSVLGDTASSSIEMSEVGDPGGGWWMWERICGVRAWYAFTRRR